MFAASSPPAVFAQLSTSVTDDGLRIIIVALLVVAALLGAATVWFFIHTSPRRKIRQAEARRQSRASVTAQPSAAIDLADPPPVARSQPVSVDDDDDWLRVTAPQRRPAPGTRGGDSGASGAPKTNG